MKSITDILFAALVPKSIRFALQLALRHLLSGGGQTLLTVSAVAAGVIIVIFKRPVTQVGKAPDAFFPVRIIPFYIGMAILAAIVSTVIAAVLPARRAAKLNPVEVMRQ